MNSEDVNVEQDSPERASLEANHPALRGEDAAGTVDSNHGRKVRGDELLKLRAQNTELQSELEHHRQSRIAALNLMEDAIAAHRSEQAEIAHRRRIEEQLLLADRRKDEFLATLAHELRNPLAAIRGALSLLQMDDPKAGSPQSLLEILDRQVAHMVRLVDDLMEISRITRGTIELRLEAVDIAKVLHNALEVSGSLIESGGHSLQLKLPDAPIVIRGDAVRLTQVFANVLNNAARYTPRGGRIRLNLASDGSNAIVRIQDNGIGIPQDMLSRIFDPFTQIHDRDVMGADGLGIGLALVRSLVTMHGGTIEARSSGPREGSEFIIRLPLSASVHVSQARSPQPINPELLQQRILVVDDNADAAIALSRVLEISGASVRTVGDGPAAIVASESFHPSVVLMDIGMPGMNGHDVARQLRQTEDGRHLLLVAISGWGQPADLERSQSAGFDHHLVKPIVLDQLLDILKTAPGTSRSDTLRGSKG